MLRVRIKSEEQAVEAVEAIEAVEARMHLPSMECMAWPISWKRLSRVEGERRVGERQPGEDRLSMSTTMGSW